MKKTNKYYNDIERLKVEGIVADAILHYCSAMGDGRFCLEGEELCPGILFDVEGMVDTDGYRERDTNSWIITSARCRIDRLVFIHDTGDDWEDIDVDCDEYEITQQVREALLT